MMKSVKRRYLAGIFAAAFAAVGGLPDRLQAEDGALQSNWVEGFNNKVRLVAGRMEGADALHAGIEIMMPKDWKTYWRNPGDAGGIPPFFDFSTSENVEDVKVLFPAPQRLIDKTGATIGYKDSVVFPVSFKVKDPSKPAVLRVKSEYGVCKEICVPAEASLDLSFDAKSAAAASPELARALNLVPRAKPVAGRDPALKSWKLDASGAKPLLKLEVIDPGGAEGDVFLEAPDGLYIPLPKKLSTDGGSVLYEVDLSDGTDLAALKGKALTVTLTGAKGQSETVIALEK